MTYTGANSTRVRYYKHWPMFNITGHETLGCPKALLLFAGSLVNWQYG